MNFLIGVWRAKIIQPSMLFYLHMCFSNKVTKPEHSHFWRTLFWSSKALGPKKISSFSDSRRLKASFWSLCELFNIPLRRRSIVGCGLDIIIKRNGRFIPQFTNGLFFLI